MTTDLREETIKGLRQEGAFDMSSYGSINTLVRGTADCGSPCCMAGHVVAAGARMGIKVDVPDDVWQKVAFSARALWAMAYGAEEGQRLEFDSNGWGKNLPAVTVDEAIAHLNGAEPARHDDETDDE
jgi:hypothetical protein